MNDFKAMARIISSIRASENMPAFDPNMVDPSVLKCDEKTRDLLVSLPVRLTLLQNCC